MSAGCHDTLPLTCGAVLPLLLCRNEFMTVRKAACLPMRRGLCVCVCHCCVCVVWLAGFTLTLLLSHNHTPLRPCLPPTSPLLPPPASRLLLPPPTRAVLLPPPARSLRSTGTACAPSRATACWCWLPPTGPWTWMTRSSAACRAASLCRCPTRPTASASCRCAVRPAARPLAGRLAVLSARRCPLAYPLRLGPLPLACLSLPPAPWPACPSVFPQPQLPPFPACCSSPLAPHHLPLYSSLALDHPATPRR